MKTPPQKAKGSPSPPVGKKVLISHGHDETTRETTTRFLEDLGLTPITLHEQTHPAQTIIEEIEHHGDIAFAVVLLTPDEVGSQQPDEPTLQRRAQQSLILELGYFLGRLGRTRVAALVKGELEPPTDHKGVLYIPIDNAGTWKMLLTKELKAAGLNVDLSTAI